MNAAPAALGLVTLGLCGLSSAAAPPIEADDEGNTTAAYREAMREQGLPVPVRVAAPKYPKELENARQRGCVVVRFTIGKDGKADTFQILNSLPAGEFDRAALGALYHWEFEPGSEGRVAIQPFLFDMPSGLASHDGAPRPRCAVPSVDLLGIGAEEGIPRVIRKVAPDFPPELARKKTRGCVLVSFDITRDGLADEYEVLVSKPAGAFDPSVLAALNQWQLEAGSAQGRAAILYRFAFVGDKPRDVPECPVPPQFLGDAPKGATP